ncbi:hypothetical protein KA405_01360 [Patescibacteria group bacterium]|nr:hypothetical protein [Patescibacteria group bacterium]
MKHFVMLIMVLVMGLVNSMNAQQKQTIQDCLGQQWPGCSPGYIGALCCEFIVENKDKINPKNSKKLQAGTSYTWRGMQYYPPAWVIRQGPCCILDWILERPCPKDAGICNPIPPRKSVLKRERNIAPPTFIIPTEKKCPIYRYIQREVCEGDSIFFEKYWFKPGLTMFGGPDTITAVSVFMNPKRMTQKTVHISQVDSVFVNSQWQKSAGIFTDSLNTIHGCDSLVVTEVVLLPKNNCPECVFEREKWLSLGRISVQGFILKESHNDWENQHLGGFGVNYEYRFRENKIFKTNPCFGESILGMVGIRETNQEAPSSNCLTCNNLPKNASIALEGKLQYKVSWLKGWPVLPSLAAGPALRYTQGGDPALRWGLVFTPEVEGIILHQKNIPSVSIFAQHNLSLGSIPSDWRVGVRVHIGRKK